VYIVCSHMTYGSQWWRPHRSPSAWWSAADPPPPARYTQTPRSQTLRYNDRHGLRLWKEESQVIRAEQSLGWNLWQKETRRCRCTPERPAGPRRWWASPAQCSWWPEEGRRHSHEHKRSSSDRDARCCYFTHFIIPQSRGCPAYCWNIL